jgi:hypothetical protein
MDFEGYTVNLEQLNPILWRATITSPDNLKFVGQIQTQVINEAGVYNEWKNNKNFRNQFFLELETKNEIIKA